VSTPVAPYSPTRVPDRASGETSPRAPRDGGVVIGDGTTAATRAKVRWRRWRWVIAVAALVGLVGVASVLPEPRTSGVALAPDNPAKGGARALAQILGRQGVDVTYVRTSGEASAAAKAGTTLLITNSFLLSEDQVHELARTKADLVLLDPQPLLLDAVTDAADVADVAPLSKPGERDAQCADPDASAAGSILAAGAGYMATGSAATICFRATDGAAGAYLAVDDGGRRVVALGDPAVLTNATLASAGNAALAVRMLGHHRRLTWYVPSTADFGKAPAAGPAVSDLLPPWAGPVGLQLLLVALVAGLWRGRRLGRLVTEPLPVTVRAAETTRGRGRLYRRSRSYGHAAAALRAGVATRSAARIGLPRSAGSDVVIDALARATGRRAIDVAALLYGPPPTDDAGLEHLARGLDHLESEVHRT